MLKNPVDFQRPFFIAGFPQQSFYFSTEQVEKKRLISGR
jgi:hypothetical protein